MQPTDTVVHSLIDRRSDPAPLLAHDDDFSDLVRRKVAETELLEFSFLVQLVTGFQGDIERCVSVRGMKVEDLYAVRPELFEIPFELLS